ncbi:Chloroperoxidase [Lentinula detonsa]|uniref:Chloroperoxidase n=1 Tax=Lentinula detonsa TaxID=2804962 RepID=A0AA38UPV9_9AGAR|nr:Chloroperoxidase [Lentinula detonsa]
MHKILTEGTTYDATLTNAHPNGHVQAIKRTTNGTVQFDPSSQYVSTTGTHAFVPPGPNDSRGPCPGLNAMANHGYIPHSGIATIDEFAQGTYEVFGMGSDLSLFLPVYGTALDGDIPSLSFSIGSILSPLLLPEGLTASHNNYEADVSPTRGDLYEYDNNYDVQMSQFLQLYNLQSNVSDPSKVNYDLDVLTAFRLSRFQQSIDNNQYFFNGPITGVLVQPAAYQFIFRFMANKSEEYPEGRLDREVLKSFFSITGPEDNLVYTPGQERIPDNWYKRAIGDEYGLVALLSDTTSIGIAHPEFLSVGGNTGEVDTFTGVDFADLTGGVFNATTLLEGNNLGCFLLQGAVLALPTGVSGLVRVLDQLEGTVNPLLKQWNCPQLQEINESLLENYPGFSRQPAN